ncbi:hypothetical protein PW52_11635 [Tamlana sedimentorum]|uniref:DUF1853 domain-containing protein n=1 Tax=Neotamlana sedimentorum TaxID=1435349 RepID=A0A0D7W839_9FLAO|nr:DUF1853 family protein [Tamlana sedimentorum]KJD35310.1 hypothetical protein PW52_11635 [Tamlana sedimentorum]
MFQKHYKGFLSTPTLWESNTVFNLQQFNIKQYDSKLNINIDDNLRLGKYVERLVSFQLNQEQNILILAENIQIQNDKLTLGELDCLLLKNEKPIHLEIIYKFYLYDASVGNSEIHHFIGPNRKDSLIEKLDKLKNKQLPLLHSPYCQPYLKALGLKAKTIAQQVYFKAQLFIPFNKTIILKTLNNDCIVGYYISKLDLKNLTDCRFYIPKKKDWLTQPNTNVNWINFDSFEALAEKYFTEKFSTMFWMKQPNGEIKKMFLVWWTS